MNSADISSDHSLAFCKIRFKMPTAKKSESDKEKEVQYHDNGFYVYFRTTLYEENGVVNVCEIHVEGVIIKSFTNFCQLNKLIICFYSCFACFK